MNNACERALRPAVVQRKATNGYPAMWAATGEADVRTVVGHRSPRGGRHLRHHPQDHPRLRPPTQAGVMTPRPSAYAVSQAIMGGRKVV